MTGPSHTKRTKADGRGNRYREGKTLVLIATANATVTAVLSESDARRLDLVCLAWRELGLLSQRPETRDQAFASLARVLDCFPLVVDMA